MASKKKTAADVIAAKQAELEKERKIFDALNHDYVDLSRQLQEKNNLRMQSAKKIGEIEAQIVALEEVTA